MRKVNPLTLNRRQGLQYFFDLMTAIGINNPTPIVYAADAAVRKGISGASLELAEMQERWYCSVHTGKPDYSVYGEDLYLAEVWDCWEIYSKKYLVQIQQTRSLPPRGVLASMGTINSVADLGNGLGITSAAFTQILPHATIYGTNVDNSKQMDACRLLADLYGFNMCTEVSQLPESVDLLFASEYFEHFTNPIEHLHEIVQTINPRCMLLASTFGGDAIGHFDEYPLDGDKINGKQFGRYFNTVLRSLGYQKISTSMWNNRPAYWVRSV